MIGTAADHAIDGWYGSGVPIRMNEPNGRGHVGQQYQPTAAGKALLYEAPQPDQQTFPRDHSGLAAKHVAVGALGGIVVAGIALAEGASWSVAALGATDVAALVFAAWVWISVAGADAGATARLARAEDASRTAAEAVLLGAGAASLLAVGFTLAQASQIDPSIWRCVVEPRVAKRVRSARSLPCSADSVALTRQPEPTRARER
jgi:Protein of unknown function (DUF1345)